jgi:hypothetical protein
MFAHFPWADIYSSRSKPHTPSSEELPGNIIIRGNGENERLVVNMMGQYYPGSPRYPDSKRDGVQVRQKAFANCLDQIAQIPYLVSVAFPWQIGCGAAGGDWIVYRHLIREFAEKVDVPVRVYKLPNESS